MMLPDHLVSLQRSVRVLTGPERDQASTLLIQTYQLAAEAGFKLGRADLAWIAADRGIILAEQLAPEEVRCRPVTKRLITALVQSFPRGLRPSVAFKRLAHAVGVTT